MKSQLQNLLDDYGIAPEHYVVIGSSVLEMLGLRQANDIDLVVSEQVFEDLKQHPGWQFTARTEGDRLAKDDFEVFTGWSVHDRYYGFDDLRASAKEIDSVICCDISLLIAYKQDRDLPKDQEDLTLLAQYENGKA